MAEAARDGWLDGPGGRWLRITATVVAAIGQLVVLLPFTVASGLIAPLWAVVALHLLWCAGAVALVAVARRRALAAPLVPLANALLWWLAMTAGGQLLGWTP